MSSSTFLSRIFRRRMVAMLTAFLLLPVAAPASADEPYPQKPIRLVVPYPPGGGVDIFARIMAKKLGENTQRAIIVENRAGANGIIGTEAVARAEPDGYTLLLGNIGPNAINQALYRDLPYDCIADFQPVILAGRSTHVVAVHPKLPVNNIQELIALAHKKPEKLTFASSGLGGSPHLAGELFMLMTNTKMLHVPYKGASPANTDLVAGHVDLTFTVLSPLLPYIRSQQLRPLAVTTQARSPLLDGVPTVDEAGVPGYDVSTWFGIFAPAKTPDVTVSRINALFTEVLNDPEIHKQLSELGYEIAPGTQQAFSQLVKEDVNKWKKVVKDAHISVE